MKKRNIAVISFFMLVIFMLCVPQSVQAAGRVVRKGTIQVQSSSSAVFNREYIEFYNSSPGFFVMDIDVSCYYHSYSSYERIDICLSDDDGLVDDDMYNDFPQGVQNLGTYYFYTSRKVAKGNCSYTITNRGKHTLKIKYTITSYPSYSTYLRYLAQNVTVQAGCFKKVKYLGQPEGSRCIFTDIKSSNPNIAQAFTIEGENNLAIEGYKTGTCKITLTLVNKKKYVITVKVVGRSAGPKLRYTNITMTSKSSIQNTLYSSTGKVTWKSSNPSIAKVDSAGKITGVSPGKCTISAVNGGKTLKCSVSVVYENPNFSAYLTAYYTRDNYFVAKFWNKSNKPLTIYSGNKVEEHHYKTYDRSIRLSKPYTIQPNKTATLKFFVNGSTTWYDYRDFTLRYYFIFDGKKYDAWVSSSGSCFKNGSKWYNTYWDDEFNRRWWK